MSFNKKRNILYNFKLNTKQQQYAEFVIDDETNKFPYSKLVSGEYDLVFIYGTKNFTYTIVLKNNCPANKPFKCLIGNDKCVATQTDCDCPDGYTKCGNMNYCVHNGTENYMCSNVNPPNQKVCPFGKVLCADLSCRDNYTDCSIFYPCEKKKNRCPDQTCHRDLNNCPKTIDCGNSSKYVCNNDKCVDSELECDESVICDSDPNTYLCDGNECARTWEYCPKKTKCWSFLLLKYLSLCEDGVCRSTCP